MREAIANLVEMCVRDAVPAVKRWELKQVEVVVAPALPAVYEERVSMEISKAAAVAILSLLGTTVHESPTSAVFFALDKILRDERHGTWTDRGNSVGRLRYTPPEPR